MFLDFFRLAFRNIIHRKRRSWLTIIGIFIGIASVVALVSLGQGLEQSINSEFESIGGDKIFINPGGSQLNSGGGGFSGTSAVLTDDDLDTIERSRGVGDAAGIVTSSVRVTRQDQTVFASILGMPTEDPGAEIVKTSWAIEIESGRDLVSTDTSSVVVGSRIAEDTFDDDLNVRSRLEIEGKTFRVAGIMKPTGDPAVDSSVAMPINTAREITGKQDRYDWIFARIQDGFESENVKENIERELRRERNLEEGEEDFTVSTPQDLISSFQGILSLVQGVVVGIASISLLVGGVGIMNTMYTSVTERTREIGVMKAIGATNRQVMTLFLLESGIIGLVGGGLGIAFGLSLSYIASIGASQATSLAISASFEPGLILGALGFSFVVGTLSGILPARRASRLQPAEALRYE